MALVVLLGLGLFVALLVVSAPGKLEQPHSAPDSWMARMESLGLKVQEEEDQRTAQGVVGGAQVQAQRSSFQEPRLELTSAPRR